MTNIKNEAITQGYYTKLLHEAYTKLLHEAITQGYVVSHWFFQNRFHILFRSS
jgi:hypothetical protein